MNEPLSSVALLALLDASAQAVAVESIALGDLARTRPADGDWCANEIVGHLIEAERRAFNGRIRGIHATPDQPLTRWDPPADAAARRDQERTTADLLSELAGLRADSLALLRALTPADLVQRGEIAHEWATTTVST